MGSASMNDSTNGVPYPCAGSDDGSNALLESDPVLREIVERLNHALRPARIYLFGSRARREAGPHSDYDILVLVDRPSERRYHLAKRGFRALRGVPAAVDVVVWDRETFDARLHLKASFAASVVREGILIHAA